MSKIPKQQSMKSRIKELPRTGELPDDWGFLPQTFVYGSSTSDYPSFFQRPKIRLQLEYYRFWQAMQGYATFVQPSKATNEG